MSQVHYFLNPGVSRVIYPLNSKHVSSRHPCKFSKNYRVHVPFLSFDLCIFLFGRLLHVLWRVASITFFVWSAIFHLDSLTIDPLSRWFTIKFQPSYQPSFSNRLKPLDSNSKSFEPLIFPVLWVCTGAPRPWCMAGKREIHSCALYLRTGSSLCFYEVSMQTQ